MKKSYTNGFVEIAIQIHFKMINIPKQIEKFNFVLIQGQTKKPFEKEWHKKIHKKFDKDFQEHIKQGNNYGVQSNNSFIGNKFLIVIDFDTKEFQDKVINLFPKNIYNNFWK